MQQQSPFKFLDSYSKEDKDFFFGREMETEELYDRVFETNLILLYGASGTGKTSLINCGLGNQFESTDWFPIFIRRGDNIIEAFHRELDKHAVTKLSEGATIIDKINSLYLDYFKPIYLIFDQFEELFILGEQSEQIQYFESILELIEEGLQCKILISMREEYIAYLSEYEVIVPFLFDNRQRIEKMSRVNIERVIEGTANYFGIDVVQPEVTLDLIIENLKDKKEGIDLANLQVYMDRLYKQDVKRKAKGKKVAFDPELVRMTGELEDVLSDFLDEQISIIETELAEKGTKRKGIPLDVLFALVTDNGTKHSLPVKVIRDNLFKRKKIKSTDVDYCIQRFQEMRILRELTE